MSTDTTHEFFDGFAWAVPTAFAEPLAACRFEQGDVLYDTRRAYEAQWGEALPHITHSLQVKSPLRGAAPKSEKEEESVFTDNWSQAVVFGLTEHKKKETKEVKTTQGRLYTLLWKGDLRVLDAKTAAPHVPALAMQLLRDLPRAMGHVRKAGRRGAKKKVAFLMPYDPTRQLLRSKLREVQTALADHKTQLDFVPPEEVGLAADAGFAPTVSIACFRVEGASESVVEKAVKRALYKPAKERKTAVERFRVTAHGHLESL
jgi:hypothetical protein